MSVQDRWRAVADFARPFTLIAPALGFFSGAVTAMGDRKSVV